MKDNPVAKHANKFNRSATHVDQKKRLRAGYSKHPLRDGYSKHAQQEYCS